LDKLKTPNDPTAGNKMFAQWWRDVLVQSVIFVQRLPTRTVAASKAHHCANTNVVWHFIMTIRTTIVILTTVLWSCQDKREKVSDTLTEKVIKSDLLDILDNVPPADNDYHFNTITDNFDTKNLIFLPDSVSIPENSTV